MDQLSTQTDYEFGGFRLDTVLQVLVSEAGVPVALPARAYAALRYLVERAGELVDKNSLMRAVWPNTIVEDNNLNQCILILRRALGEAAGERRFILTVPGHGFKFVAPVRAVQTARGGSRDDNAIGTEHASSTEEVGSAPSNKQHRYLILGAALLAVVSFAGALAFYLRSPPATSPAEYVALTDLSDSATAPTLSPDGKMLAFIRGGSAFLSSGQVYVKLLPDGEPLRLTNISGSIYRPAFSPDGTRIAFTSLDRREGALQWNTWSVPVTGGEPSPMLSNAAGLSWISAGKILYSEVRTGLHMGIVASAEDRAERREIYFPSHERGMAHYSYPSPDGHSILIVEMDRRGDWQRCRLVPFDGSTAGTLVGPAGRCQSAAWSPDGHWMYFSADVGGHSHLWRQHYPHGEPLQITFGPTEEQGVEVAPDGHSLVTSLGLLRQTIWIHDASGERRVTRQNVSYSPWLSPDAKRLYFLSALNPAASSSLWRLDLQQGQQDLLLPSQGLKGYDISPDEREVVFSLDHDGEAQIWIAPLDRRVPPKLLARTADEPAFDNSGHVFFRLLGEKANYLYRMQSDGNAKQRVLDFPILDFDSVSPTGRWAAVQTVTRGVSGTCIVGLGNESFRWTRNGWWPTRWSVDGRMLYLEVGGDTNQGFTHGRTLPIAIAEDAPLKIPEVPPTSEDGLLLLRTSDFFPGSDPGNYLFTQSERLQNIYRIPLHQ